MDFSKLTYYPKADLKIIWVNKKLTSKKGNSEAYSKYLFGFNGKEKDIEGLGGGGLTLDYGFRIYNPGLGRFLSVDPLFKSYPWYTPYQFAGNMPIWAIDLDGLEEKKVTHYLDQHKDGSYFVVKTDVQIAQDVNVTIDGRAYATIDCLLCD